MSFDILKDAIKKDNIETVRSLIENGVDYSAENNYALILACFCQNINIIKLLINKEISIHPNVSICLEMINNKEIIDLVTANIYDYKNAFKFLDFCFGEDTHELKPYHPWLSHKFCSEQLMYPAKDFSLEERRISLIYLHKKDKKIDILTCIFCNLGYYVYEYHDDGTMMFVYKKFDIKIKCQETNFIDLGLIKMLQKKALSRCKELIK